MDERFHRYLDMAVQLAISVGARLVGAFVLWIIGRMVIRALLSTLDRNTSLRRLDETLARYLNSAASVALNLLLIVAILSVFGIETTTFASLLAAAGVAVGLAWSGLLSNMAAGVFMVVLRPFKTGDIIRVAGVTGTVHSIGLFVTTIDTPDNVRTFIGNNKIFSDTIQNFSANPYRRVDLAAQLAAGADHNQAIGRLKAAVAALPHVLKHPAPEVELFELTPAGPVLAVRPFCHNDHYWAVYFAANAAIRDELTKQGSPAPA